MFGQYYIQIYSKNLVYIYIYLNKDIYIKYMI